MFLLQKQQQQQEIDEHVQRQKNFQKNHLCYFSDPFLLRSLETTSINSQSNIHREIFQQRPDSQIQDTASKSNIQTTPMDYTLNQPDDRVYRYTTGNLIDNIKYNLMIRKFSSIDIYELTY